MMIKYKTTEEIEIMQEGGRRLKVVAKELMPQFRIGMTTKQIDSRAEELIVKMGGEASFKKVPKYHWSTCLCLNEQIVHTPPSNRELKDGDILTVDIGMFYRGFHTDYADTVALGKVDKKIEPFLRAGKKTLNLAINKVKIGQRLGVISRTIQEEIEKAGYAIIKELTGHGVGKDLHEDPSIPGFVDQPISKSLIIKPGLVVAIEVIYAMKNGEMEHEEDDSWSIRTVDRSLSACFEHSIAVTEDGPIILT